MQTSESPAAAAGWAASWASARGAATAAASASHAFALTAVRALASAYAQVFPTASDCGLDAHSVEAALSRGAAELRLPAALAAELLQFLIVRKDHPDAGPSYLIDQLWHWMLLNTAVAEAVHGHLGGVVHHSTSSAADPPLVKMLRRLRSLNELLRAGHSPSEQFWQEPGVVLSRVAVLSLFGVRTGRWVYVAAHTQLWGEGGAPTVDPEAAAFVAQSFCAPGETLEVPAPAQRATEAPPPASEARAPRFHTDTLPESDAEAADVEPIFNTSRRPAHGNNFSITIRDQTGGVAYMKVKRGTTISAITETYCNKKAVDGASMTYQFKGGPLDPRQGVVGNYNMRYGSEIYAAVRQMC